MEKLKDEGKSHEMGMHTEQLAGRTQQIFFSPTEEENFTYPHAYDVDFNKRAEFDAREMDIRGINLKIRELMSQGYGTIVVKNPLAKHSLGVGILNRLQLYFEGSLGYFGCGLIDGPNIRIKGRVGWSCAENMMSGTIVIEKNAGSSFGAAIRGGDLVCLGNVGGRTGINMKGGTIIIGGKTGAFSGFMWITISYISWALSAALAAWMLWDWFKTDSEFSEEVLTSSREGEIEAVSEKHQLKS